MPTVNITEKAAANRRLAVSLVNMVGTFLLVLALIEDQASEGDAGTIA